MKIAKTEGLLELAQMISESGLRPDGFELDGLLAEAAQALEYIRVRNDWDSARSFLTEQVIDRLARTDAAEDTSANLTADPLSYLSFEGLGLIPQGPDGADARVRVLYWSQPKGQTAAKVIRREVWTVRIPAGVLTQATRCSNCGAPASGLVGTCRYCGTALKTYGDCVVTDIKSG